MPNAVIETSKGPIRLNLFAKDAPKTVENFTTLAKKGFYDGTAFHRVIPNFMIQGGDPHSKTPGDPRVGTGGPGYRIKCEINPNKHTAGTLSMAHAGKDTGGSQFFITHKATPHLDGVHTVFGHVVGAEDQKVVDSIKQGDKIVRVTVEDDAPAKGG
jgi:peptidyl-prolyl cis-trans isomerase B (cyclophilin B)